MIALVFEIGGFRVHEISGLVPDRIAMVQETPGFSKGANAKGGMVRLSGPSLESIAAAL